MTSLPADLLAPEPTLPWSKIAATGDRLAHRSFDPSHAISSATVQPDLPDLEKAARRLSGTIGDG